MKNIPEIGLSTASLYPRYLTEEALIQAAELAFPVVEVFLQTAEEYDPAFGVTLDQRRRATGVRVHSIHLHAHYFHLWSEYTRMLEEAKRRFLDMLNIAVRLEAHALTWHGLTYGLKNKHILACFYDGLAWASEQARAVGITLCVENVSWCYLRSVDQITTLRSLDLPISFTFDTFQAGESDQDPVSFIQAMGSDIRTVHLADYDPDGPRHLPPGHGTLDWPAIFHALRAVEYGGPLIIELAHVETLDTLRDARTFIKQQLHAVEQERIGQPT